MQSILVLSVLSVFAFVSLCSASPYVGVTTQKYNGSMNIGASFNGYAGAAAACALEFDNAHVCTVHELGLIAQSNSLRVIGSGEIRLLDLSHGHVAGNNGGYDVNDCKGFTSASNTAYSKCVTKQLGGPLLPSECTCDRLLSWICCRGTPGQKGETVLTLA